MEERENRKGPGVFYAVIGVATLVVAIIGATFAYFSVTLTSGADDITGTTGQGADGNMSLLVQNVTNTNTNMIPLTESEQMQAALNASCKDDNSNNVCNVYKITVTNNGQNAVTLAGKMTLTSAAPNMKWKLIKDEKTVDASKSAVAQGQEGVIDAHKLLNANNKTGVYYVVVWLQETGKQQDAAATNEATDVTAEAAKSYTGTVTFNAVDANGNPTQGGLTATFSS